MTYSKTTISYDPLWNNCSIEDLKKDYNINVLDWESGECYEGSFVLKFESPFQTSHGIFDGVYKYHAQLDGFCFVQNASRGFFVISLLSYEIVFFARKEVNFEWISEHPIKHALLSIDKFGEGLSEFRSYTPKDGFYDDKLLLDLGTIFPAYELQMKNSTRKGTNEEQKMIYLDLYLEGLFFMEGKFDLYSNKLTNLQDIQAKLENSSSPSEDYV